MFFILRQKGETIFLIFFPSLGGTGRRGLLRVERAGTKIAGSVRRTFARPARLRRRAHAPRAIWYDAKNAVSSRRSAISSHGWVFCAGFRNTSTRAI